MGFAQQDVADKVRLANEYYQSKEFEKAAPLYFEIYEATTAKIYFSYFINCKIELAQYDDAEKEIKKQMRKDKADLSYAVDLGYLYKKRDLPDKAKKEFEEAIENIKNQTQVYNLSNAFINRQEYDYAEECYRIGKKITGKSFLNEFANLYSMQRKYPEMINAYLDILEEDSKNLDLVQNRLQYFISNEQTSEFSDILRISLLKRVQKDDHPIGYNQMLVWLYMQEKDFRGAFIQAKAIDKRVNGAGQNIIELAENAVANGDYDTALDAYKYVIDKGRTAAYYISASVGRLRVYYEKVISNQKVTEEEAQQLEAEYLAVFNGIGIGKNTAQSVIDLAHLQAFYLNKPDDAIKLLEQVIAIKGLSYNIIASCKIELGDVYLAKGDIWEAALIYGQAEKENKENAAGDDAKLRKAKLAYFANDFLWARAQFDALKASTSKEVANDALFYAMLIKDNTEEDSLMIPMKLFAKADLLIFRKKYTSALTTLDTLLTMHAGHTLTDEAYLRKSEIYKTIGDYEQSKTYLLKIITEWSWDILADVAVYKLAVLYDEHLENKDEAAEYYKKLMIEYPNSIYVTEARKRFRQLRDGIN